MLKLYKSLFNEAKQAGILYHFTYPSSFSKIVKDGYIKGFSPGKLFGDNRSRLIKPEDKVISVSRNKNFNFNTIRLALDGNKISERYKIIPYQEYQDSHTLNVAEEVIVAEQLSLKEYLLEVEIVRPNTKISINRGRFDYFNALSIGLEEMAYKLKRNKETKPETEDEKDALYIIKIISSGVAAGRYLKSLIR